MIEALALVGALVPLALLVLTGCAAGMPPPISSDRTIYTVQAEVQVEAEGKTVTLTSTSTSPLYVVAGVWLQERYQLERSLRLSLERCVAQREGTVRRSRFDVRGSTFSGHLTPDTRHPAPDTRYLTPDTLAGVHP